ncbi:hypothetical protein OEG86_06475 [Hoeflea alexandrii]|uniref:hypothetical protein n=1 Tax=Hoeflea alexandrii TaxID=288436 RepID=UPI00227193AC|nr:hypothetical protein [Hoeflea alexandrii]MCY0151953.1 hypothetical protein [Hoeflea alexandrii]
MSQTYRPVQAALWMCGSISSFSAMAVAGRYVSAVHSTFEIMAFRSLVGLIIVLGLASASRRLGEVRRNRLKQHFFRNLFHFTGQNLWFLLSRQSRWRRCSRSSSRHPSGSSC